MAHLQLRQDVSSAISIMQRASQRVARRWARGGQARLEACRDGSRDAGMRRSQCKARPSAASTTSTASSSSRDSYLQDVTRHRDGQQRRRNESRVLPKHAVDVAVLLNGQIGSSRFVDGDSALSRIRRALLICCKVADTSKWNPDFRAGAVEHCSSVIIVPSYAMSLDDAFGYRLGCDAGAGACIGIRLLLID